MQEMQANIKSCNMCMLEILEELKRKMDRGNI